MNKPKYKVINLQPKRNEYRFSIKIKKSQYVYNQNQFMNLFHGLNNIILKKVILNTLTEFLLKQTIKVIKYRTDLIIFILKITFYTLFIKKFVQRE